MANRFKSVVFVIGFAIGLIAFVLLNGFKYQADLGLLIVQHINPKVMWDADAFGFPFIYYYTNAGGIQSWSIFSWVEALANIVIALLFSSGLGSIFNIFHFRLKPHIK